MPYINKVDRTRVDLTKAPKNAGELNYIITTLLHAYVTQYGEYGECYQAYNDCIGALEGAKLELYRRRVARYEDLKIEMNGDL